MRCIKQGSGPLTVPLMQKPATPKCRQQQSHGMLPAVALLRVSNQGQLSQGSTLQAAISHTTGAPGAQQRTAEFVCQVPQRPVVCIMTP